MKHAEEIERFLNEDGMEKTGKKTNKALYACMKREVNRGKGPENWPSQLLNLQMLQPTSLHLHAWRTAMTVAVIIVGMGILLGTGDKIITPSAAEGPEPSEHTEDVQGLHVLNVQSVKPPEKGTISSIDVRKSDHLVSRVIRLAPGATIKEHYHPFFDEVFFVHSGALTMMLNVPFT